MQRDISPAVSDRAMPAATANSAVAGGATWRSGLAELIGEPGFVPAVIMLPVGLAAIGAWRAAAAISDRLRRRGGRQTASHPAFENLIGRPMPVGPGADIGDDLFAGCRPRLDGRRAHVGQQHHVG